MLISAAATTGITRAGERLERLAVQSASGDVDAASSAAEPALARVQLAASVAVARAANRMMGTLLDIVA
jgi:hypothetical protein